MVWQHCECLKCHWIVHFKMNKMRNFILPKFSKVHDIYPHWKKIEIILHFNLSFRCTHESVYTNINFTTKKRSILPFTMVGSLLQFTPFFPHSLLVIINWVFSLKVYFCLVYLFVCFLYMPHISEVMWYFSFSWLLSLRIITPFKSIHIVANHRISFFFKQLNGILLCIYHIFYHIFFSPFY